jgi:hypothetical protein
MRCRPEASSANVSGDVVEMTPRTPSRGSSVRLTCGGKDRPLRHSVVFDVAMSIDGSLSL